MAILVTDGQQTTHDGLQNGTLQNASRRLKDRGVEVLVVGIGSFVDPLELELIASRDDLVLRTTSFQSLSGATKAEIIQKVFPGGLLIN